MGGIFERIDESVELMKKRMTEEKKKDAAPEGCVWVGPKLEKKEDMVFIPIGKKDEQVS